MGAAIPNPLAKPQGSTTMTEDFQNDGMLYDSADMYAAWQSGFNWCAEGVEIDYGELFIPHDQPGVEGYDHAESFGFWIEEYDSEHGYLPVNHIERAVLEAVRNWRHNPNSSGALIRLMNEATTWLKEQP
jgi:hypothetical protein